MIYKKIIGAITLMVSAYAGSWFSYYQVNEIKDDLVELKSVIIQQNESLCELKAEVIESKKENYSNYLTMENALYVLVGFAIVGISIYCVNELYSQPSDIIVNHITESSKNVNGAIIEAGKISTQTLSDQNTDISKSLGELSKVIIKSNIDSINSSHEKLFNSINSINECVVLQNDTLYREEILPSFLKIFKGLRGINKTLSEISSKDKPGISGSIHQDQFPLNDIEFGTG